MILVRFCALRCRMAAVCGNMARDESLAQMQLSFGCHKREFQIWGFKQTKWISEEKVFWSFSWNLLSGSLEKGEKAEKVQKRLEKPIARKGGQRHPLNLVTPTFAAARFRPRILAPLSPCHETLEGHFQTGHRRTCHPAQPGPGHSR